LPQPGLVAGVSRANRSRISWRADGSQIVGIAHQDTMPK
jgi:hypothetical protein